MINLYDKVRAVKNLDNDILIGFEGTVVYNSPGLPDDFMVEFFNEFRETIKIVSLKSSDIEKV
jgi:Domain of unknown function (DUF4926)